MLLFFAKNGCKYFYFPLNYFGDQNYCLILLDIFTVRSFLVKAVFFFVFFGLFCFFVQDKYKVRITMNCHVRSGEKKNENSKKNIQNE